MRTLLMARPQHLKLGTDFPQRVRRQMIQRLQKLRNQGFDVFHPIALRRDYENGDRQSGQILLKLDVLIRSEEHVEAGGRKHQ